MTEHPYEPPEREFTDTMLAFRDLQMTSTWRARIEPDPLGDVNKIVTLMRGNYRVKSVLARVPVGAPIKLGHDVGTPRIRLWGPTQELAGADAPIQVEPWEIAGLRLWTQPAQSSCVIGVLYRTMETKRWTSDSWFHW